MTPRFGCEEEALDTVIQELKSTRTFFYAGNYVDSNLDGFLLSLNLTDDLLNSDPDQMVWSFHPLHKAA